MLQPPLPTPVLPIIAHAQLDFGGALPVYVAAIMSSNVEPTTAYNGQKQAENLYRKYTTAS